MGSAASSRKKTGDVQKDVAEPNAPTDTATKDAYVEEPAKNSEIPSSKKPKVFIIFYSMYGHIKTLAEQVKEGVESTECEACIFQIDETLPEEVLTKMNAPPKDQDIPSVSTVNITEADGIIFGLPTRFGMLPTQAKALLDSTGGLWQTQALAGMPASVFFSTATQGGGQETTAFTLITQLTHHGMLYVPLGYSTPLLLSNNEVHGGSPYGAGCLAGPDGSRQPSDLEKKIAFHQGQQFATFTKSLTRGQAALAAQTS